MDIAITHHALDRFRIHHPEADKKNIESAWNAGVEVGSDLAQTLAGRPVKVKGRTPSCYRIAPDRQGMLVAVRDKDTLAVVTYLRFQLSQRRFAEKHWPVQEPEQAPPPRKLTKPEPSAWSHPQYPNQGSKVLIYQSVLHPFECEVRHLSILQGVVELCGSMNQARRYIYYGQPAGPSQRLIRLSDGREVVVHFHKITRHNGETRWYVGLRGEGPGMWDLASWRENRPRGPSKYVQVYPHTKTMQWGIRQVEGMQAKTLVSGLGSQEEALRQAPLLAPDTPLFVQDECVHCGNPVGFTFAVHPHVWEAARYTRNGGRIHPECLEERLGRDLTLADLTDSSVNNGILFGCRLIRHAEGQQWVESIQKWDQLRARQRKSLGDLYVAYVAFMERQDKDPAPFRVFREQMESFGRRVTARTSPPG